MAQKVDLYTLLRTFSHKSYSAEIDTETFIKFMEKNVQRENAAALQIEDWRIDTRGKILRGINELVAQNKIVVTGTGNAQKITLTNFYSEIIEKFYFSIKEFGLKPLPDEKTMRLKIPESQVRTISAESGLIDYLEEKRETPNQIIRMMFSDNYGSAIALESHIPEKILEISVMKIELVLRNRNEMEYFSQKLITHFAGQETRLREFITMLITRPADVIRNIEESNDFTHSIWLFLCPLIRRHVEEIVARTNDRTPDNIALVQAATLILTINNHYQIRALDRHNRDVALNAINEKMSDPPFIFTISDMLAFKNQAGVPFNQRFGEKDLEDYLKEKMALTNDGKLPQLLKFKTKDNIEWFVKKERMWQLCIKLLAEAQPQVKNEITQRWMKILKDYRSDPAMEKDSDFEDLLTRLCNLFTPQLLAIVQDKKTAVLQDEILAEQGGLPKGEKFFDVDRPIPLRFLLGLRKEDVLYQCRLSLPFWYSIKALVKILFFLKYGMKENNTKTKQGKAEEKPQERPSISETLHDSAEKLAKILVPEESDIDSYLDALKDRWNQLLDKTAQKKLCEDLHAIIKAHLNQVLKLQKPSTFNNQMLEENAERIIKMNVALDKINNKNALRLYIKVYITKLILNQKRK